MKYLIIGDGAREHAMAEALVNNNGEVYAAMAKQNIGIAHLAVKHWVGDITSPEKVVQKAGEWGVEQCIVGSEKVLEAGAVDALEKEGFLCASPNKSAARIGNDRAFFRELVQKHNCHGRIAYQVFDDEKDVASFIDVFGKPVAIKPLGGTDADIRLVCDAPGQLKDLDAAKNYAKKLMKNGPVVIEEYLTGEEFTLQGFVDHDYVATAPAVRNYRFSRDGDKGSLTQGMGSYSTGKLLPFMEEEDYDAAAASLQDVVKALAKEEIHYRGAITGEFILTEDGPKLIEVRPTLGDPQAMNVLPIMKTSFGEVCEAINEGELKNIDIIYEDVSTVCVYVVPKGYPNKRGTGKISLPRKPEARMYYNAVEQEGKDYGLTGGRAIAFVGKAETIEQARAQVMKSAKLVKGEVYYRKDIGDPVLVQRDIDKMDELRSKKREQETNKLKDL